MCGIAGIVGEGGKGRVGIVGEMTRALALRGPDGKGVWCDASAALGHRRLSIIDLDSGGQPMVVAREGQTHAIVFNGEIYNYQALGALLQAKGDTLNTRSDTEVLLRLLTTEEIHSALNQLHGMFAFAWWNAAARRLTIARDRLGIKPLFYHLGKEGTLSFSSSLESLLCNPDIKPELNVEALEYFLTIGYPPAPLTLYEGIFELPPAHLLTWENGQIVLSRYWSIAWEHRFRGTQAEAVEHLSRLLDTVIKDHLVSDVPVGALLSGGLDSSAVVARAARTVGAGLQCFTVSFPDSSYDESPSAREVAEHVGVKHTVIPMEEMVIDEDFCRFVMKQVGQPFADSSCLPTYLVSKVARQSVKVVLAGDGGDELFAGYNNFDWGEKILRLQRVPRWLRRIGLLVLSNLHPLGRWGEAVRQMRKAICYSFDNQENMLVHLCSIIDPDTIPEMTPLYGSAGPEFKRFREYLKKSEEYDFVTALSRFMTEVGLPGDMLRKVDSMSMAASLEVRVPFLDHRIVEFAQSLPKSMKVQGHTRKVVLRKAVAADLPAAIFRRPKKGFEIPLHKAYSAGFRTFCAEALLASDSRVAKLVGRNRIAEILSWNAAESNPIPYKFSIFTITHLLWMLIQLELWAREKRIQFPDRGFLADLSSSKRNA